MVRLAEPDELVFKEPGLDIELPRVFILPKPSLNKVNTPKAREALRKVQEAHIECDREAFAFWYDRAAAILFPITNWLISCWDYLLTVEGPRFTERTESERAYLRGDYRVVRVNDYQKLVFREFKRFCLEHEPGAFTPQKTAHELLRTVRRAYADLEKPRDYNQRNLTAYSYLRCVPYAFLNKYHENRVKQTIQKLPREERITVELYFLHFYSPESCARKAKTSLQSINRSLERGLTKLARKDFLSYRLLLQIARY